jgi:WD40 repeat protein
MHNAPRDPAFEIIACPHPKYEPPDRPVLPADAAAEAIADLLRPWGGRFDPWDCADRARTLGWTESRLKHWHERGRTANTVLTWLGHGETDPETHSARLFVRGEPDTRDDSTVEPKWFAEKIRDHLAEQGPDDGPWTIVMIEACGGARFAALVSTVLKTYDWGRRTLVIGSGRPNATQFLHTLKNALEEALNQVTEDVLPIERLASLLRQFRDGERQRFEVEEHELFGAHLQRVMPGPVTAVWNDYRELRRALDGITADDEAYQALMHYATKGTGTDLGEFAWHFVGRTRERRAVFRWLHLAEQPSKTTAPLLVVSGPPASGKSALLGSVLIDCHPDLAHGLEKVIGERRTTADDGSPATFDVTLHLTGATVRAVAGQLRTRLGAGNDPAGPDDPVAEVYRLAGAREKPLLVMADALDESEEPAPLAHFFNELLRSGGIRLVIGTRARSAAGTDLGAILTSEGTIGTVLELEPSPDDVIESLAVRVHDNGLREQVKQALARRTLQEASQHATPRHQFLWAAMAAEELNTRTSELLRDPQQLDRLLDTDHRQLFRLALDRLETGPAPVRTALLALALAHGRGLPRQDRVWEEAAGALSACHEPVTLTDLNDVLAAAGAYVMLDHEQGQGVYRLAHRALQEQLLEEEAEQLADKRLYMFRQLLAHVRPDQPLNPYLRQHLSTHAAYAQHTAWEELGGRPDVLDRLDPYAVAGDALRTPRADRLPAAVLGTINSADLVRQGGDDDRAGLRMLGEGWVHGATARTHTPAPGAWFVRWSILPQRPVHLPVGEIDRKHNGTRALALVPRDGASGVLAVAAGDTTVRIWDPVTGQLAGGAGFDMASTEEMSPYGRGVAALTALEHRGRTLLAGATVGGRVAVWDPFTGRHESTAIRSGGTHAIAVYRAPDGGARLALAHGRDTVERVDPMTGRAEEPAFHCDAPVSALLTAETADGTVIVALAQSGTISAWHAATGRAWGKGARLDHGGADMALLHVEDTEIVLAVLDGAGTCTRCRLRADDEQAVRPGEDDVLARTGNADHVCGLRTPDGRDLLATADGNGGVRLWDPHKPGHPIAGWQAHREAVDALVAGESADGRGWALATIGKGAGVARIWPLSSLEVLADPPGEGQIRRAAVAGPLAVLAGRTQLTFVDATEGTRPAAPAHLEQVVDLATVAGLDPLIVAASRTELTAWRAHDSSHARTWTHPGPTKALAGVPEQAGFLASIDTDGVLRRWDAHSGTAAPQTAETGVANAVGIVCLQQDDGVVVAIGGAGVVHRWRCQASGAPQWTHLGDVDCAKRPVDTTLCAVGGADGDPGRLFIVTADRILCTGGTGGVLWQREHPWPPPSAACAWREPNGAVRLAVGSESGRIALFDATDGRLTRTIPTGLGIRCLTATCHAAGPGLLIGAWEGAALIDVDGAAHTPSDGAP